MFKIGEVHINLREIYLFLTNGIISTVIHFVILFVFVENNLFNYISISYFCAAIISISISFVGNKYLVFKNKNNFVRDMLRFFILYIILLILNSALIYILCDIINIDYKVGFIIALVFQTIFSYLGLKLFVFSK